MFQDISAVKLVGDMVNQANAQMEKSLEHQLSDLVKRGVLVMETTGPTLVKDCDGGISVRQSVTLHLKDKEYIEKLEAKVKHYERILDVVRGEDKHLAGIGVDP